MDRLLFFCCSRILYVFNLGVCSGIHHLWSSLGFMFFISCRSFQLLALETIICLTCLPEVSWERLGLAKVFNLIPQAKFPLCSSCWLPLCLPWAVSACFRLYFSYHTSLFVLHFPPLYFHFVLSVSTSSFRSLIIFKMLAFV